MRIILASKSPRRRELLNNLGVEFDIEVSDADENYVGDSPEDTVTEIARRKGRAVRDKILSEGEKQDARRMLDLLSGREHRVVSGIYLYHAGKEISEFASTKVTFSELSEAQTERYLDSDEPYDKAGAYAVQGRGSVFVERIEGDFFNVVGLPLNLVCRIAKEEFGIELC